jgi:hypothetical protein
MRNVALISELLNLYISPYLTSYLNTMTSSSSAGTSRTVTTPSTTPEVAPLDAVTAAVNALKATRIKHTRIGQMMSELHTQMHPQSPEDMMLVCGPAGIGKTTLARFVVNDMVQTQSALMNENAGLIPAIYIEAPASGEDEFSWRLFYDSILCQLDGDLSMPKHKYGIDLNTNRFTRPSGFGSNTLAALRTSVESALRERGTQYIVIDEAAHIFQTPHRKKLERDLNTLKSLFNKSGTQMVLIGSYDLYQLMSLSGQLARRTHVLHFDRYRQDNDADIRAFHACVQKFQSALPELWGQKLLAHSESLHENTLGCIGTLSSVLTRATRIMLAGDGWSPQNLQRGFLADAQYKRILEEILDGEEAINPGVTRTLRRPVSRSSGTQRKVA